jgi:CRISPR-associated protein Cas2
MLVMILEKVPASLRGELSCWLIEAHPGIYIGHVSAMVRDQLWDKCCTKMSGGSVFQAWNTNNEQHFDMRTYGRMGYELVEMEGLKLMRKSIEKNQQKKKRIKRIEKKA